MADIVNLNRFRKQKRREAELAQAERNRVVHGRSKAEKDSVEQAREFADRKLEGLRREEPPVLTPSSVLTPSED